MTIMIILHCPDLITVNIGKVRCSVLHRGYGPGYTNTGDTSIVGFPI